MYFAASAVYSYLTHQTHTVVSGHVIQMTSDPQAFTCLPGTNTHLHYSDSACIVNVESQNANYVGKANHQVSPVKDSNAMYDCHLSDLLQGKTCGKMQS